MSAFGDLAKRLRLERGWTLERTAKAIGSHKGYVSGFENDKVNPPSAKIIKKLAKALNTDPIVLLRFSAAEKVPIEVRKEFLDFAMALSSNEERALFLSKYFGIPAPEKKETTA